jgi:hypothetical protein
MSSVRRLLTRGNGKLGEAIHVWSIPAVTTCPGRSSLCEAACYARGGRFRAHTIQDRLAENLDAALADDFVPRVVAEVRRQGVHTLRVHVAGDFFSSEYVHKWATIACNCPRTTFYAYSRSWRVPEIAPALADLARLHNFKLWYSIDRETGAPAEVPPDVRVAYLLAGPGDSPSGADLAFRTRRLRREPARRLGLTLVCPTENGEPRAADTTCTSCRRCYE